MAVFARTTLKYKSEPLCGQDQKIDRILSFCIVPVSGNQSSSAQSANCHFSQENASYHVSIYECFSASFLYYAKDRFLQRNKDFD
jgi:hypothetical protein